MESPHALVVSRWNGKIERRTVANTLVLFALASD